MKSYNTDSIYCEVFDTYIKKYQWQKKWNPSLNKRRQFGYHELFWLGDSEQRNYAFLLKRCEKDQYRIIVEIIKRLLDIYEVDYFWDTSARVCLVTNENGMKIGYEFDSPCDDDAKFDIDHLKLDRLVSVDLVDKSYQQRISTDLECLHFICLEDFFRKFFSVNEYSIFACHLKEYKEKLRDTVGYKTTPFLTSENMSTLRSKILTSFNEMEICRFAYELIDDSNSKYRDLPNKSVAKADGEAIHKQFIEKGYMRGLVGNSDYAKSFITSEWLYHSLKGTKNFDYTSIVCGYLKSVEQLLQCLLFLSIDKTGDNGKNYLYTMSRDKSKKKRYSGAEPIKDGKYSYIPLITENMVFFDFTLANLNFFFGEKYSDELLRNVKDKETRSFIHDVLDCFRIECRNGYFHKDNIYDWEIVEKTRHNVHLIFYLVLGAYSFGDSDDIGIVEPDKFDVFVSRIVEVYNWSCFFEVILNQEHYFCIFDKEKYAPTYNEYGNLHAEELKLVIIKDFSEESLVELDNNPNLIKYLTLSRHNMPQSVIGTVGRNKEKCELM